MSEPEHVEGSSKVKKVVLSDNEREIIITKTDAEEDFAVYVDRGAGGVLGRRLISIAKKLKQPIVDMAGGGKGFIIPVWVLEARSAKRPASPTTNLGEHVGVPGVVSGRRGK